MTDLEALRTVTQLANRYDDNMLRALFREYRNQYGRDPIISKIEKLLITEAYVKNSSLVESDRTESSKKWE